MSEFTMLIYVRHPERAMQRAIGKILRGLGNGEEQIFRAAARINPALSETLTGRMLSDIGGFPDDEMMLFEDVESVSGYMCGFAVAGIELIDLAPIIVNYFYDLDNKIRVQAYITGDDDPWERWIKVDDGKLLSLDCSPFSGEDEMLIGTVYRWWHEDLPKTIREGLLNQEGVIDDDADLPSEAQYQEWLEGLK